MGKWVKVHPREEKQVGRRFNLLPQHRKWLPAGSGEPPDLHHLVSRSRRTPSGERGEERSDSVPPWLFFYFIHFFCIYFLLPAFVWGWGWWRWRGRAAAAAAAGDHVGAGFTGVKGHKPPGFPVTRRSTEKRQPDQTMVNKGEKKQLKLVRYVRAVPVCGTSLQRVQQRLVEKHEGNTRSHERIGRTTSPPLFLLPKLHKDKDKTAHTHVQKDALTISCMAVFFCPYKSSSRRRRGRWPQRDDVCGRKVRFDVVASFLRLTGEKSEETVEWMKIDTR